MAYFRIYADGKLKEQREFSGKRLTIGRAEDNDIVLRAPGVSARHAVVEQDGHGLVLVDTDSTNGVFVNGKRVERHPLEYWDDIQIYNFQIRFMALARLPGEQDGRLGDLSEDDQQAQTMEIDVSSVSELLHLKLEENIAYVETAVNAERCRHILDKVNFTIGRGRRCDIRLRGWWTPRVVATIQRRSSDYYVVPARRGQVFVNGNEVAGTCKLEDDAELEIRGLQLKYFFRPLSAA
jgi:pSer/pThr/pTyr-binding forkhead associated (FHA) protein